MNCILLDTEEKGNTTAAACASEDDKGYMNTYIDTGPYMFTQWVQDQYVRLDRFDGYTPYGVQGEAMDGWAGYKAAPTKTLYFDFVPDAVTRTAGLETGLYDVIYGLPDDDAARIEFNEDLEILKVQQGTVALIFNKQEGLGADLTFRQAVNTCLDVEEILAVAFGGAYELGSCYMDSAQAFWQSDAGSEYYNRKDPEAAKAMLEEAGFDFENATFRILASTTNNMDRMAVSMQSQLEKIGMKVSLEIVDWATLTDYRKDASRYDLYITTFAGVPVPSLKLYFGASYPGFTIDEQIATLFTAMTGAPSLEEAKAAWDALQGYSWETLPIINAGHYMTIFAWNKNVAGLETFNGINFYNASVAL